jgi:predicted Zn-dependent protease
MSKPTDYEAAAVELEQTTKNLRKKRLAWERYERAQRDLKNARKEKQAYEKTRTRGGRLQLAASKLVKNTAKALLESRNS